MLVVSFRLTRCCESESVKFYVVVFDELFQLVGEDLIFEHFFEASQLIQDFIS